MHYLMEYVLLTQTTEIKSDLIALKVAGKEASYQ